MPHYELLWQKHGIGKRPLRQGGRLSHVTCLHVADDAGGGACRRSPNRRDLLDSLIHSRVGPHRRAASRDEGAAAYTIWSRWIASRGFDPAPVPRSIVQRWQHRVWWQATFPSNSGTARETAGQATAGQGNVGNGNRESAGKLRQGKQRREPQRRIEKVSAGADVSAGAKWKRTDSNVKHKARSDRKNKVHPAEAYLRRWKVNGGQVPVPPLCSSQPPRSPVRPASNRRFERPEIAEQRRGTGTPSVAQSCVAIVGCARFSRMNQK